MLLAIYMSNKVSELVSDLFSLGIPITYVCVGIGNWLSGWIYDVVRHPENRISRNWYPRCLSIVSLALCVCVCACVCVCVYARARVCVFRH